MAKEENKTPVAAELECNSARGEVALRVAGIPLVIAAEMGRLAAVSTALECKSIGDLFNRLQFVEVAATLAGLRFLTVRGNVEKAIEKITLKDFEACKEAFQRALGHHFEDDEGNVEAADKAAA